MSIFFLFYLANQTGVKNIRCTDTLSGSSALGLAENNLDIELLSSNQPTIGSEPNQVSGDFIYLCISETNVITTI